MYTSLCACGYLCCFAIFSYYFLIVLSFAFFTCLPQVKAAQPVHQEGAKLSLSM